jgi:stearoyl-CoA desaturase (delta-9 desaturase)
MNPTNAVSDSRAELIERSVTLVTVFAPLAATGLAIYFAWRQWVEPRDLLVAGAMYIVTISGITLGFHRLFTHKSFKCGPGLRALLGIAGSMASQGPLFFWVACHRRHHQHSDEAGDPHSPHAHGEGWRGVLLGWWHAHVGWMLAHKPENYFRLVNDLVRDPVVMTVHRLYFVWVLAGLVLPGVISMAIAGNAAAFWPGVLWGGLVRLFVVHHVTWSVNSVCHLFGATPYSTADESRNNAFVAVLTLGEGWHNNHHAFPSSARHGLQWWQVDPSYLALLTLKSVRLVWDIRTPSPRELLASSSAGSAPAMPTAFQ